MGWRSWKGIWWRARVPSLVVIKCKWLHGDDDGAHGDWTSNPHKPLHEKRRSLICQEVIEQVLPGGVVQGQVEVQEWVAPVGEGWEAQELAQVLVENAFVLNAERLLIMKLEYPATL